MLRILNRESANVKRCFEEKAKKLSGDFVQGE